MPFHDGDFAWTPFRPGVDIHRFVGDGASGATGTTVALLRYAPGASVPRHLHRGTERILVLAGSQSDELGEYGVGSYRVNPAGSEHKVESSKGCVVLIVWDQPIELLE